MFLLSVCGFIELVFSVFTSLFRWRRTIEHVGNESADRLTPYCLSADKLDTPLRQEFFDSLPIRQSRARTKHVKQFKVRKQGGKFSRPLRINNESSATGTKNTPHFHNGRHQH